MTQPGFGHMRASSAERERAVDVLKAAFAEGRLTQDEYTDRVGQVHASKTYGDLAALTRDLPVGPLGTLPAPPALAYQGYPAGADYPPTPFYPLSSGYAPVHGPVWGPAYQPAGPYRPRAPVAVPRQREALAVTSLAVALAAVTFPPATLAAIGLGIAALVRIRQTGKLGRNFAVAGIALGTLGALFFIVFIASALAGA